MIEQQVVANGRTVAGSQSRARHIKTAGGLNGSLSTPSTASTMFGKPAAYTSLPQSSTSTLPVWLDDVFRQSSFVPPPRSPNPSGSGANDFAHASSANAQQTTLGGGGATSCSYFERQFLRTLNKVHRTVEKNEFRLAEQDRREAIKQDWQQVALVVDRALMLIFVVATLSITLAILLHAPHSREFILGIFGLGSSGDSVSSVDSADGDSSTSISAIDDAKT